MNTARNIAFAALLNIAAILVSTATAQSPNPAPANPPPRQPIISLQFAGGTLGDYVKALQSAAGNVNIMVASPEAREIKLPPIKLESVGIEAAVELLSGRHWVDESTWVILIVNKFGASDGGLTPVFKLWTDGPQVGRSVQVRVWNIGHLLSGGRKAEAVLTAVETAVGLLDGGYRPAKIRYHEETTLLVASGEAEQLKAIDRVVDGLREGAVRGRGSTPDGGDAVAGLSAWIEDARRFEAERDEKGKSNEQGVGRIEELRRLLDGVRAEVQHKDRRIQELERRLQEEHEK